MHEAIRQEKPRKAHICGRNCSHIVSCTTILNQKQHTDNAAATVFPKYDFLLFLKLKRHRDKDGIEDGAE